MGLLARAIHSCKQPGGWITTLVTGALGALVVEWVASAIFGVSVNDSFFNLGTWLFAIGGGLIVAFIWRGIASRN